YLVQHDRWMNDLSCGPHEGRGVPRVLLGDAEVLAEDTLELIEDRVAGDELYDPRQAEAEGFVTHAAGKLESCYEDVRVEDGSDHPLLPRRYSCTSRSTCSSLLIRRDPLRGLSFSWSFLNR